MKKKYLVILLLFALGISFNSCTKDFEDGLNYNNGNGNGNENPLTNTGIFTATVGGSAFAANQIQAIVTDNYTAITGIRSSKGDLIQIILPSNKVGTYTWENSSEDAEKFVLAYALEIGGDAFASISKEDAAFFEIQGYTDTAIVKITAIDKDKKTISGTFQFTGFREIDDDNNEIKVITNGSFTNISYTEDLPNENGNNNEDPIDNPVPIPSSKYAMTAKVDGILWEMNNPFNSDYATKTLFDYYPTADFIQLQGRKGGMMGVDEIELLIKRSNLVIGSYSIGIATHDGSKTQIEMLYNSKGKKQYVIDGNLSITSIDLQKKIVKGTFSFNCAENDEPISTANPITTKVTEGTFNYRYDFKYY